MQRDRAGTFAHLTLGGLSKLFCLDFSSMRTYLSAARYVHS